MVRTAVIPGSIALKRQRNGSAMFGNQDQLFDFYSHEPKKGMQHRASSHPSSVRPSSAISRGHMAISPNSLVFGVSMNAAPDAELYAPTMPPPKTGSGAVPLGKGAMKFGPYPKPLVGINETSAPNEEESGPIKKKYAKEAWPGRKPTSAVL